MCSLSFLNDILDDIFVPTYEIRAQFRLLEPNGSVRSLITIKVVTDDNAVVMLKSRRETSCGVEYC